MTAVSMQVETVVNLVSLTTATLSATNTNGSVFSTLKHSARDHHKTVWQTVHWSLIG